jgi:hypothetical protein
MNIETLIDKVLEFYGASEAERPGPLPKEAQRVLADTAQRRFNVVLPGEYLRILERCNGFLVDGAELFGDHSVYQAGGDEWPVRSGFVEANEIMRADGNIGLTTVCFGTAGDSNLVMDVLDGHAFWQDTVYGERKRSFSSFEEMILKSFGPRVT